jgi:hypothetical protein
VPYSLPVEPQVLRAETDRALLELRLRTGMQIVVCGATMLWAMVLTRPLSGAVVVTPPAAFAVAVALGREQAIRRRSTQAFGPDDQLAFLRRFVDELVARRRRLRIAGPVWTTMVLATLRFVDLGGAEALRAGLQVVGVALVAMTVYAFISVPRLVALRARLGPAT